MQKYLLWKSNSLLDLFILNRKKKQLFRKVTAIRNFLFSRSGYSVEFSLWKRSFSEKITAAKKWVFWKRRKKELLQKCNCSVEVVNLKKSGEVASPKLKLSWKSRNTCEKGNCYLKINPKLDSWLHLIEIIFPERFPLPGKYSYGIPHEYLFELTKKEIIRFCLCHTIFINF